MKNTISLFFLLTIISAQSQIKGCLQQHPNQELSLIGFDNFKTEKISTTTSDSLGNFTLIYPSDYKGMAVLETADKSSLMFVLTESNFKINATNLNEKYNTEFVNSKENNLLIPYLKKYSQDQSVLSAWNYLKDNYENNNIFNSKKQIFKTIKKEINRIEKEDAIYIKNLDKDSYLSWYLPIRKLVSDMPNIVRNNPAQIPKNINEFRKIDFKNPKFKTSGLLKNLLEGHYMLLENMEKPIDSVYNQMNRSTKYLIANLTTNQDLLNDISTYLFDYLEKRSLHSSSQYLALQLLSQNSCGLDPILTNKLESYRTLKVGKTAPDIVFANKTKLSETNTNTLLVFGASWCSKCKEDAQKLNTYYTPWKEKGVEIVYISIDTDKTALDTAYKNRPWKTDCAFLGWDTPAIKDYHVFATPTYFLLDKDLKILLRPISIEQTNSWINSKSINN